MKRNIVFVLIVTVLLSLVSCRAEHEHTPERVAASAATCTEGGNLEYYRCTGCERLFSDAACESETTLEECKTAPLGHTWTPADCDSPRTCTPCGATEGEALGHEWSGDCDTDCNRVGCNGVRAAESHLDADGNGLCDSCGEDASADVPVGGGGGEFLPPDEFED